MPRPRSLPRLAALGLARRRSRPSRRPRAPGRAGREVAAVVGRARRRVFRASLRRDMVAAAQLDAVDAHLGGGGVDQPLHVVVALRPPGAAIGADRRRVGDTQLVFTSISGVRYTPMQFLTDVERRRHHRPDWREIGAEIAVAGEAQSRGNGPRRRAPARRPSHGRGRDCRRRSCRSARRSISPGGRARARRAAAQTYSGNTAPFMPKEPPTWPVITRIFSGGTPIAVGQVVAHAEHALARRMQREAAGLGS